MFSAQGKAAALNAEQVRERARVESMLRQREGGREQGTIAANTGASGLTMAGSASEILRESVARTAFDVASIKTQSGLEAAALDRTSEGYATAAKKTKKTGMLGFLGGAINAVGALL